MKRAGYHSTRVSVLKGYVVLQLYRGRRQGEKRDGQNLVKNLFKIDLFTSNSTRLSGVRISRRRRSENASSAIKINTLFHYVFVIYLLIIIRVAEKSAARGRKRQFR